AHIRFKVAFKSASQLPESDTVQALTRHSTFLYIPSLVVLAQQVTVHHEVTGFLGKKVVLPCSIALTGPDVKLSQVTWVKEIGGRRQNVAVYHPSHGQNYPMEKNSRRIRFLVDSLTDATLVIEHLLMTDEGTYSCEFATYPYGNEVGTTNLIVLGKTCCDAPVGNLIRRGRPKPLAKILWPGPPRPSQVSSCSLFWMHVSAGCAWRLGQAKKTAFFSIFFAFFADAPEVYIEGYDDNWYLTRSDAVLICNARGNPTPVDFSWTTGQLPKSVEVQGERLLVKRVDYTVNTTFICQATNRVGQVSTQQIILVRGKSSGLLATFFKMCVYVGGLTVCGGRRRIKIFRCRFAAQGWEGRAGMLSRSSLGLIRSLVSCTVE
uniref:Ig-like domain-containing protein n=1 Tax=Pseudonaja textilis TaxID=8673 RepID=A0A670ZXM5_PSETE